MRSLKTIAFTFLLLFVSNSCRSQVQKENSWPFDWESDFHPGPRLGFSWQGEPSIEIGFHALWRVSPHLGPGENLYEGYPKRKDRGPLGWWNAGFAVEFPLGTKQFIIGPKFFTEFNVGPFSTALNVTFYTSGGTVDPRITPEIGLATLGFLGVRYGYNWAPLSTELESVGEHRITIFLMLVMPRAHNH